MSGVSVSDPLRHRIELKRTQRTQLTTATDISISAPGRICLFGEHQDYLGLPVIAAAINLRVDLKATPSPERRIRVELPDIGETLELSIDQNQHYRHDRDYLPAGINVIRDLGIQWSSGWDVTVKSGIPINAGASSSSALQVAWTAFLLAAAGEMACATDPLSVALLAHSAEVTEFGSPGGTMDHFSSAFGGLIWLDSATGQIERLKPWPGEFVLVNSGIPKDTNGVLAETRARIEKLGLGIASHKEQLFTTITPSGLATRDAATYSATVENKALTASARTLLEDSTDSCALGVLLSRHHSELVKLGVSHPEIDRLLSLAEAHGSLGGKINGSGGGGSFFVLAPEKGRQLQQFYQSLGLQAWVIHVDNGLSVNWNTAGKSNQTDCDAGKVRQASSRG